MIQVAAMGSKKGERPWWWWSGLILTPVRVVTGFMFLSAFLRRVINAPAKLNPASPAYLGYKFNAFYPHAIGIKPVLGYLLDHPQLLHFFTITFTVIEGLIGLFLILGFLTRLSALGSALVSLGILLGAGWIGPTCLDEWQIGSILIATGLAIAISGSGPLSVDNWLLRIRPRLGQNRAFLYLFSGGLPSKDIGGLMRIALVFTLIATVIMLFTYQAFFSGLWGKLHNDSKKPGLEVSVLQIDDEAMQLKLYRHSGPDTYGAFVTEITIADESGKILYSFKGDVLSNMNPKDIENRWPYARVKVGPYGLIVPLSAEAVVSLSMEDGTTLPKGQPLTVTVFDASGAHWSTTTMIQ